MQRQIFGLANAMMDVTVRASYEDLKRLGVKKGETVGCSHVDAGILEEIVSRQKPAYFPAGSTANVIFNADALGLKTVLFGIVGNDKLGERYSWELFMRDTFHAVSNKDGKTGRVYVLITPDGERSQVTDIGVAGEFDLERDFVPVMSNADFFHTSGYEVASNPQNSLKLVDKLSGGYSAKVSFDLASGFAIRKAREQIEEIAKKAFVLFATEEEAMTFTYCGTPFKALNQLAKTASIAVLKRGEKGSVVRRGGKQYVVEAYPAKVKNTCGAGDAYTSGFLFGCLRNFSLEECGRFGSFVASRVCASELPHL